jgi:hypothetical protein
MQPGRCPLTAHRDFVAAFGAALDGGPLPPGVPTVDPVEAQRRFSVYRNNVAFSLSAALASRFPVIRRLVGAEFFAALAGVYVKAEPPQQPVLHEWGAGFPAFLAAFPPLAAYPYMADVARIELARGQAFHAADVATVDPVALAGTDPARLCLGLHPSVTVLALDHPAVTIWQANQPGQMANGVVPDGPETALILRDRGFGVPVRTLDPGDAALVRALAPGASLVTAALAADRVQPGHDPQPILVHLTQAGALIPAREA